MQNRTSEHVAPAVIIALLLAAGLLALFGIGYSRSHNTPGMAKPAAPAPMPAPTPAPGFSNPNPARVPVMNRPAAEPAQQPTSVPAVAPTAQPAYRAAYQRQVQGYQAPPPMQGRNAPAPQPVQVARPANNVSPPVENAMPYLQAVAAIEGRRSEAFSKASAVIQKNSLMDESDLRSAYAEAPITGTPPKFGGKVVEDRGRETDQWQAWLRQQDQQFAAEVSRLSPPTVCGDFQRHYLEALTIESRPDPDGSALAANREEWAQANLALYHVWEQTHIQPFFTVPSQ